MNEEQASSKTKAKLPLKTRIAVWWILVAGLLGTTIGTLCFLIWCTSMPDPQFAFICLLPGLVIVAAGILYIIPSILLTKRKSWSWTSAIIVLIIDLAFFAAFYISSLFDCSYCGNRHYEYTAIFIIYLVPLTLIIIDRKNYFAMLRQREIAKNKDTTPTVEP